MPRADSNVPGDDGNSDLRILRLVESFEDGWVAGSPTPLEDWLAAAPVLDRDELLGHALAVEVAHRRRRGEAPAAGDYLDRFPDHTSVIQEAFAEATPRPDRGPSVAIWPHPGGSVLEALDRSAGPLPRVLLGDPRGGALAPVVRPSSTELPAPAARPARVQLLGEIARGAMGAVLKGCDPDLGRDLAVKVLLEEHRHRPDLIRRFVEEAQIGGQLQHPGIVPVYELGVFGDARPYFTMKLVKGQTLTGLLAARTASSSELPRFLETFLRVAQTVAYAHARGVVHRDLKPSNIMVGPFGEVQVMDWGLAKVLPRGGVADDRETGDGVEQESVVATTRSGSEVDRSRAGSVLGTPSYMAPEQADGQIERVDERADVFALGSILCEILTGRPAFTGRSSDEVLRSARRADLSAAFARLEACGADDQLVRLARACLAPAWDDRLRNAHAVADQMQAYLDGVHRRIREAELARAAAAARAEEARATALVAEGRARAEGQARRMTAGLAATVLIAVALGTVGWRWVELDRIRRRELISARVNAALQEATRLRGQAQTAATGDLTPWVEALAAADKAGELLEPGCAPALRAQVESLLADITADKHAAQAAIRSERADRKLLDKLVDIRSAKADDFDGSRTDADYARAFRDAGIDVAELARAEAGARIKARPAAVAGALTAALDDWASVRRSLRRDRPGALRLAEVASAVDPAPWRVSLRRALDVPDRTSRGKALQTLAASANLEAMPAVDLDLLGTALSEAAESEAAEQVLRAGRRRFPEDVWLNYDLAGLLEVLSRREEAIRYYSIARALRPETALALANALKDAGESDEALAVFEDLLRRRPDDGRNYAYYGQLLRERGDRPGSLAAVAKGVAIFREAVRLGPDDTDAHTGLAFALTIAGKRAEAAAEFRTAIRLRPDDAQAYSNLGAILTDAEHDYDGAVVALRTAVRLRPEAPDAHMNLGVALQFRGELAEAITEYRTAIRLRPDDGRAYINLGNAQQLRADLAGAIAAYRTAIRLRPGDARAHANLGVALRSQGKLAEAIAEFRTAVRVRPDDASSYINLGSLLSNAEHDYDGAVAALRTAVRLRPDDAQAHTGLGIALGQQGKLAEAIAVLRSAIRLRPDDAEAHTNLAVGLQRRGELAESEAELRAVLKLEPGRADAHCSLGKVLQAQGRFEEALVELRSGHQLGSSRPDWRYPSDEWVRDAECAVALSRRLPAVLAGDDTPKDPAEWLAFARLCSETGRHAAATRLYADALRAEPKLAGDRRARHAYAAASSAALAGCGKGKDVPSPDQAARARLRGQALDWLRGELLAWSKALDKGEAAVRDTVREVLEYWKADPNLAAVREPARIAELPDGERPAWRALWADVEALLNNTRGDHR